MSVTRVSPALGYAPQKGALGETGDKVRQTAAPTIESDLKHYKPFIEQRSLPTAKWLGEIDSGRVKK